MRPFKLAVAVTLGLLLLGVSAQSARAEDAFAKITGATQGIILGDQPNIPSIPAALNNVQVFGTGISIEVPAPAPGGGTTGRPTPGPLILTKSVDRASPKLLRAAFFGEQLTVDISWIMNLAGTPRQTVTIKLEGASIAKIDSRAELTGPNASFGEIVTLSYQKITMTVPTINAQGQVSGTTTICLDLIANKAC
jgi:type VI secretion system Hcp family effector